MLVQASAYVFVHYPVLFDAVIHASGDPTAPTNTDDEKNKSGPWGLAIVLLLAIGCYFLFRSMSRHLKKVREEFPPEGVGPEVTVPPATPDPKP